MLVPKGTYKPEHCFVVTNKTRLPLFDIEDVPTKIVITPYGFYFFFEDRPYTFDENTRLAKKYMGNPEVRRIYRIDGEQYCQYEGEILTTNIANDLANAVKHLQGLDSCINLLSCMDISTSSLEEVRAKRKMLVDEQRLYAIADRVINIVREGDNAASKMWEFYLAGKTEEINS